MEKYSNQIIRLDGDGCFLEVLNNAFPIGKVQINFCQYDKQTKKEKIRLEIFIPFETTLALAKMITSNRLNQIMAIATRDGKFQGKTLSSYTSYFTILGGKTIYANQKKKYGEAQKMFPGLKEDDGKYIISRQFKIQKASKEGYFVVLRAEYANGKYGENRQIIPNGKSFAAVTIPLSEINTYAFAETITVSMQAYLCQYYQRYADILFKNQSCNIWQRSSMKNRIDIIIVSSFELVQENLYHARVKHGKEFSMYFMEERIKDRWTELETAMETGRTVNVLYETIDYEGGKLCYFVE